METAFRVLTAINEKHHPDPNDVDALRTYAGPQPEGMTLEDFARDVIQKALNSGPKRGMQEPHSADRGKGPRATVRAPKAQKILRRIHREP